MAAADAREKDGPDAPRRLAAPGQRTSVSRFWSAGAARAIGERARRAGKPVLPLATTGGDARVVFWEIFLKCPRRLLRLVGETQAQASGR